MSLMNARFWVMKRVTTALSRTALSAAYSWHVAMAIVLVSRENEYPGSAASLIARAWTSHNSNKRCHHGRSV